MENKKVITAGIIIIGNEVLSGRTKDINTSTLAKWLNSLGIEVKEVRVIPDNETTIIETVNILRKKFNYIFTTGGIGPTHDDITSESISKAFKIEYGFHKEAYSILEKYYKPGEFTEGRQKMSKMPISAKLILNPTSGAPGFKVENVFCLPGHKSFCFFCASNGRTSRLSLFGVTPQSHVLSKDSRGHRADKQQNSNKQ